MRQHIVDRDFAKLSFNAKLLLKELNGRGIECKELGESYVVEASFGGHNELLYDVYTALNPYPVGLMIDDKYYTKKLLEHHGFTVPKGKFFTFAEKDLAIKYAETIGFPVVVKPTIGTHGQYVYVGNDSSEELSRHIDILIEDMAGNGFFLVEKHSNGDEYRLFTTGDGFFAAVKRVPANITGDGTHSLRELVEIENHRRMHPRNTCLCEIILDDVVDDTLRKQSKTLAYVPPTGETVFLRHNSNVSTGGDCIEVTDQAHPTFRQLASDIRKALNVPFIGIDVLTPDAISTKLHTYAICELNGSPGLSLHMMPGQGAPQDTAAALADLLFPETKR